MIADLSLFQIKREHGLPQFDLDAEMNKLSQKCWGLQYGFNVGILSILLNSYIELT